MRWLLILAAVLKLSAQCGIQPTPEYYDGTHGSGAIPGAGATNTVLIDTGTLTGCNWTVTTSTSWIAIANGQMGGTGSGSFTWTAAPNPSNTARSGSIKLSGNWVIPVVQLGANCTLSLSAANAGAVVAGNSGSLAVQTACQWTAFSNNPTWIAVASPTNGTGNGSITYTVSANGCVAARSGAITVEAGSLSPSNTAFPITTFAINQDGSPANLTLSPANASADASGGPGKLIVNTGSTCAWSAYSDVSWLQIVYGPSGTGASAIDYNVTANTGPARTGHLYVGAQQFTLVQQAPTPPAPLLTAVVNAASYAGGAIAPGEIVALGGTGLGPVQTAGAQLTADGKSITSVLGGVQVLFDGKYPATPIYVSPNQVNAIAPYEIAGQTTTQIQVMYQGMTSAAYAAPVQAAAPGIFTLDANGLGAAAILNQDYTVNGNLNPAHPGSAVMIFCTGGGVITPPATDGAITVGAPSLALEASVIVTIGGVPAQVSYAGGAPQAVAGLNQINAQVPVNVPLGKNVPVTVQIGNWQSPAGPTMVIQ